MTMTKRTTMRMMYRSIVDIPAVIIISERENCLNKKRIGITKKHHQYRFDIKLQVKSNGFLETFIIIVDKQ